MKYKVGDKVRIRKGLEVGKDYGRGTFLSEMIKDEGQQVEIVLKTIYGSNLLDNGWVMTDEMLEDAGWERGDIITDGNNFSRILGVCGEVVFPSIWRGSADGAEVAFIVGSCYSQKELEEYGWHLYTEPSKEETIDLLGQTYKKEEIEKVLKDVKPVKGD